MKHLRNFQGYPHSELRVDQPVDVTVNKSNGEQVGNVNFARPPCGEGAKKKSAVATLFQKVARVGLLFSIIASNTDALL